VRFYAALAGERGGPVLELGSGAGRVAREIARNGVEVVGVDRVGEMLSLARRRIEAEPRAVRERVAFRRGDLRAIRLRRRFPLIIAPFNVMNHLYTRRDWERALDTVRRHLAPRGRFVFDVRVPDATELARSPGRTWRGRPVVHPGDGRRYRYGESFEWDPVTQIELITMQFEDAEDPSNFYIVPLAQRHVFPAELEALLHYNGWTITDRWGDFARGPLRPSSESQIVVARPPARRAR
jgi:SAM-dependent methyltransferase